MNKRDDLLEFKAILEQHGIKKLYHFTDRENLESIIKNGGLYSWGECNRRGIIINQPGGSVESRAADTIDGLDEYVKLSFVRDNPIMYEAMTDGRITNPVILEIDPVVVWWEDTMFADRNVMFDDVKIGNSLVDFIALHFDTLQAKSYFDLMPKEKPFYQAEVMVRNFIPLEYITNIRSFGFTIPSQTSLQPKIPYTAQITRNTPTAFIFLIDQSVSMNRKLTFQGEEMTLSGAVARIVNHQINELVLRCIKGCETRNYYDIAVIGYGHKVYSGWNGALEGRDFVTPSELKDNPCKKIVVREEKRTRHGTVVKEVEKVQWIEPRHDGNWTHVHKAFDKAKTLLEHWMQKHHEKDCYPPTIINITDGEFNGETKEYIQQKANELKSMFTNDGNVILFNIHINTSGQMTLLPTDRNEVNGNTYSEQLFSLSSLLPTRYNEPISQAFNDSDKDGRHVAMAVNVDMSTLIQLMDIGTPTNISQNR